MLRAGRLLLKNRRLGSAVLGAALLATAAPLAAAALRVNGSTPVVNPIVDPAATATIERLITTLKPEHMIILVTHDLAQAERLADRVGCLCARDGAGELVESARAGDFFADPRCGRPAALLEREGPE